MNVLVVGSGGREHAIAWKLSQSPRLDKLWIAPGNPGTAALGENVAIKVDQVAALVDFSVQHKIDLVVIGPEVALAAGVTDAMRVVGIKVFGPSQGAAQIETSKVFSKRFMQRHHIPTARFTTVSSLEEGLKALDEIGFPLVIKASGLAAGKGVLLPVSRQEAESALRDMLLENRFGQAGHEVVIEERLEGEEVSLLAFTDGLTLSLMPPAQDHKRIFDGDLGANTGGMGAYAPAPICSLEDQEEIKKGILQPTIDGLRTEGLPFYGILYAGLIFTKTGYKVLEFNARFGDPETQAILPLLDSDLLEVLFACTEQRLADVDVRWKPDSAVCVVMASAGYPEKSSAPVPISGLDSLSAEALVFQAGTTTKNGQLLASGGRVLGVTAVAETLLEAIVATYGTVRQIQFAGAQYRKDIAQKGLKKNNSAYQKAGVNIDAGNKAVALIRSAVESTYSPQVLAGIGAFGGLFDVEFLNAYKHPVLVASTDGVGTKVKLAAELDRLGGIGEDIVNHCIDDILVQGARPLFFLDYYASSHLNPEKMAEVVKGMAKACLGSSCVILGGETAEMPGVYSEGEFDLAGTIIGCLEKDSILPRKDIRPGDCLIGIRSSGPHTNGYSLLRKLFAGTDLNAVRPELGMSLADALLAPHRSYLPLLMPIIEQGDSPIKGLAHLTGGGFIENIPRVLPKGIGVHIHLGSWPIPPLFQLVQQLGKITDLEMYRVFNLGIGMVVIVAAEDVQALQAGLPEQTWLIGEVVADKSHQVRLV